jgi:thiol-disulfide isomerase/thioredoxin
MNQVPVPRRQALKQFAVWGAGAVAATRLLPLARAEGYEVTRWPPGLAVPPLQTTDLQGKTWRLADLRGRAVLLNFWASWCEPCRAEMPTLQQLAEIYGPEKLVVLAINFKEGTRKITQYVQSTGMNLPVLLDTNGEIARQWGATVFPTSILIDADGQPRQRVRGEMDWTGRAAASLVEPLFPGLPQRASGVSTARSNNKAMSTLTAQQANNMATPA